MTVVDDIEENIEKGTEAVEDLSKEISKTVSKEGKEIVEKGAEKIKKIVVSDVKESKNILKKIEEKIEKGAEKIKEIIKEDVKKVEKKVKKAVEKMEKKKPVEKKEDFVEKRLDIAITHRHREKKEEGASPKKGEEKNSEPKTEEPVKEESSLDEKFDEKDEKLAELESLETEKSLESDLEARKKTLLEKVKKLSGKVDVTKTEELKEKVKIKKKTDMLVPLEEYVKTGIYIGKRAVTPDMKPFVYRRRADGLAIFNTDIIDEKLKEAIEYMSKFDPKETILVCKRQTGWEVAEMFSRLTGIRVFTKKYPAGVLTNTQLPDFFENELTIVTDSWLDKNALQDTVRVRKKVLMICDTNNFAKGADQIIIGNNKSSKSLGIIFYILARGYCKTRGIEVDIPDLDWWIKDRE